MKLIIGSILIFSIVILFLFALFPSQISVSRMVQIRGDSAILNHKLADLREWKSWNLMLQDSGARDTQSSGFVQADSDQIHTPTVMIRLAGSPTDTILTRWQHGSAGFDSRFVLTPQGPDSWVLEWTLLFKVKWYPWDKLASMFYDKQLGPVMEGSLLKLQEQVK